MPGTTLPPAATESLLPGRAMFDIRPSKSFLSFGPITNGYPFSSQLTGKRILVKYSWPIMVRCALVDSVAWSHNHNVPGTEDATTGNVGRITLSLSSVASDVTGKSGYVYIKKML